MIVFSSATDNRGFCVSVVGGITECREARARDNAASAGLPVSREITLSVMEAVCEDEDLAEMRYKNAMGAKH